MDYSLCRTKADPSKPWAFTRGWNKFNSGIKEAITQFVWSPIVWKNGYRKGEDFSHADYCVLDFDDGLSVEQAIHNSFADCNYVIGTTKSHQIEKKGLVADRFRVIIPFTHRISDFDLFCSTMRHYVQFYESDNSCVDGARYYFPCKSVLAVQVLDKEANLPPVVPEKVEKKEFKYYGKRLPGWIEEALNHPNPIELSSNGSRGHLLFRISAGLATCGITDPAQQFQMIDNSNITSACKAPNGQIKATKSEAEVMRVIKNGIRRGSNEASA